MLTEKEIKDRLKYGAFVYVTSDYMFSLIAICLN
jgi:hypothetical protein